MEGFALLSTIYILTDFINSANRAMPCHCFTRGLSLDWPYLTHLALPYSPLYQKNLRQRRKIWPNSTDIFSRPRS